MPFRPQYITTNIHSQNLFRLILLQVVPRLTSVGKGECRISRPNGAQKGKNMNNKEKEIRYFGFALADSMFAGDCNIERRILTAEDVKKMAEAGELTPCLNPSHQPTISAAKQRYGIEVEIPDTPPRVILEVGDSIVVMGVRGLPRLTDRHEYTEEEIASANFSFSVYTVIG